MIKMPFLEKSLYTQTSKVNVSLIRVDWFLAALFTVISTKTTLQKQATKPDNVRDMKSEHHVCFRCNDFIFLQVSD